MGASLGGMGQAGQSMGGNNPLPNLNDIDPNRTFTTDMDQIARLNAQRTPSAMPNGVFGAGQSLLGSAAQPANNQYDSQLQGLYKQYLGREADQPGLDFWKQSLVSGRNTLDDVRNAFIGSDEYKSIQARNQAAPIAQAAPAAQATQSAPGQYDNQLQSFYRQYLGREADQPGLDFWKESLASGRNTLEDVRNAFIGSDEYKGIQSTKQAGLQAQQNRQFDPYGNNPFANSQNPFIQAAQQNAAGNLSGAQMATAANRVNQSTPYQNLQYKQTGVDAQGNPIWSAEQSLAPGFQQSLNNIQSNVAAQTAKPFDVSNTQNAMTDAQNPNFQMMGEAPTLQSSVEGTGMSGWDRANELLMSRLRPQMEQRNAALDAKLANQGIVPGTEAYNRARMAASQADNDMMIQAQLGGSQLQNQMFNQNLQSGQFRNQALGAQNQMGLQNLGFNNAARQQGFGNEIARGSFNNAAQQNNFQQNLAAYNNPLQQLNAFTQGTNPNYVNYYNQQPVAGPDYFGAYNTTIANQIAQQNAQMASNSNTQSGFFDLGAAALRGGGGIAGLADSAVKGVNWLTGKLF